jgi:hypothetical protein
MIGKENGGERILFFASTKAEDPVAPDCWLECMFSHVPEAGHGLPEER